MSALVSTAWLADHLTDSAVKIIDASWHMPAQGRDAHAEYAREHIPGARFVDVDALSDHTSPYPHMLPSAEDFAAAMEALGVGNDDHVVVYDADGLFSAARLWWMFRVFGHDIVSVLDGGLPKWKGEGRTLSSSSLAGEEASSASRGEYKATFRPELVRSIDQVKQNLESKKEQVADARGAPRFHGEMPEPRPGMRSGHIPGSCNIPYPEVLSPPYQTLRTQPELAQAFTRAGIDPAKPVVTSCGSGVTACILALALYELGNTGVAVYDGSWAEWGSRANVPVKTG